MIHKEFLEEIINKANVASPGICSNPSGLADFMECAITVEALHSRQSAIMDLVFAINYLHRVLATDAKLYLQVEYHKNRFDVYIEGAKGSGIKSVSGHSQELDLAIISCAKEHSRGLNPRPTTFENKP